MIDFKNSEIIKLRTSNGAYNAELAPILVEGEVIHSTFKAVRDGVVFTNKRIIVINVQGLTGAKKDITSLPYSKIQAFSTESAGMLDNDCELELWFSSLGKIRLEFSDKVNIGSICKMISHYVLL